MWRVSAPTPAAVQGSTVIVVTSEGFKQTPLAWHRVRLSKLKVLLLLFSTAYKYPVKRNTNIVLAFTELTI